MDLHQKLEEAEQLFDKFYWQIHEIYFFESRGLGQILDNAKALQKNKRDLTKAKDHLKPGDYLKLQDTLESKITLLKELKFPGLIQGRCSLPEN